MKKNYFDTIIIGAGAAGLMTAISAAMHGAKDIVILNASPRLGLKILMSGGGRCNITNNKLSFDRYYGESKNGIKKIILQFSPKMMIDFLQGEGLEVKVEEPWDKYFPASDKAQSVLDVLLKKIDELGVKIFFPVVVENFYFSETWQLETSEGLYESKNVVLACGGFSYPHTGSDGKLWQTCSNLGIEMQKDYAALTPIFTESGPFQKLSGIAHDCQLNVKKGDKTVWTEENPVLFTHFGFSGPAILNVSQWFTKPESKEYQLEINFLPKIKEDELAKEFMENRNNKTKLVVFFNEYFPRRLTETIVSQATDLEQTFGQLKKEERKMLLKSLFHYKPTITGNSGYKKAEVSGGGIPFSEINLKTMELKRHSGLYAVGEIVNVHGDIGGYNFQWAWSSGWVCGKALS